MVVKEVLLEKKEEEEEEGEALATAAVDRGVCPATRRHRGLAASMAMDMTSADSRQRRCAQCVSRVPRGVAPLQTEHVPTRIAFSRHLGVNARNVHGAGRGSYFVPGIHG